MVKNKKKMYKNLKEKNKEKIGKMSQLKDKHT